MHKETLKIVMIGEGGVGKTSLRHQFVHKVFIGSYKATIGADFIAKEVQHATGQSTTLQIWDTAGQERFAPLGAAYYRGADACILVYDVTSYPTFERLTYWRDEFIQKAGPPDPNAFPFIIVGNKTDLREERVVSPRQVRDFAAIWAKQRADEEAAKPLRGVVGDVSDEQHRFAVPCYEASAKDGANVARVFEELTRIVRMPQLELDLSQSTPGEGGAFRSIWDAVGTDNGVGSDMRMAADDGVYADDWTFRLAHGAPGNTRHRRRRPAPRERYGSRCCGY